MDNWLNNVQNRYSVEIRKRDGESHFNETVYSFKDPHEIGLTFEVSFNHENMPSLFTAEPFVFQWFNLAEGASSDDILKAADACLIGDLHFRKAFISKKYSLEFNLESFKGKSNAVWANEEDIANYLKGYSVLLNNN